MSKTLLLLDVDGPLNPYRAKPTRRPEGYGTHRLLGYRVWLNAAHGPMLLKFAADHDVELAWCTTWEHEANAHIGPAIGLPELPVVEFGFTGIHWKFDAVLEYAAGRALAWLDDEFTAEFSGDRRRPDDAAWFREQRGATPTMLRQVNPRIGLMPYDLERIGIWINQEASAMY